MRAVNISRFCMLLFFSFSVGLGADSPESDTVLTDAIRDIQSDIQRDTQALNTLRADIETERTPLVKALQSLRDQVAEQRKQVQRVRSLRAQKNRDQEIVDTKANQLEETVAYIRELFSEYTRASDTRQPQARDPDWIAAMQQAQQDLQHPDTLPQALNTLLEQSLKQNTLKMGGITFEGPAIDNQGIEHRGVFASFGPVAFFQSAKTGLTGIVTTQPGSDQPFVFTGVNDDDRAQIQDLFEGHTARVPVDVTGGTVIQIEEANKGWMDHMSRGGLTMIPLMLVGLAAGVLSIWKFIELKRMEFTYSPQVDAVVTAIQGGKLTEAKQQAETIQKPLRLLVDDLIEFHQAPKENLEEILQEHVLASLPYVEKNLSMLAVLGGIAPLLGLLGTVTGMIHTFQLVTLFGSGDATLLSGGISEALVTTETGLMIAIPTLLVHALLARKARSSITSLDTLSSRLAHQVNLHPDTV